MSSNIPYQIQFNKIPSRTSLPFLSDQNTILQNVAKKMEGNVSTFSIVRMFPSVKILDGPTQDTKLVALWRTIANQQNQKNLTVFPMLQVYIVAMDTPTLEFQKLAQIITPVQSRIRDIAVSPNKRQVILMYQTYAQRYILQKQKTPDVLDYSIRLDQAKNYTQKYSIIDISYHPSGQYVVGLANFANTSKTQSNSTIRPFKFNPRKLQFQFGPDIQPQCVSSNPNFYKYLRKWYISIDKNKQRYAMISGYSNHTCIWDLQKNDIIEKTYIKRGNTNQFKLIPFYDGYYQLDRFQGIDYMGGFTFYLNSTNNGYFISNQPKLNIAQRYFFNQTTKLYDKTDAFSTQPLLEYAPDVYLKCIDLNQINGIACSRIHDKMPKTYFLKIDNRNNKLYDLGAIQLLNPKKSPYRYFEFQRQQYIDDIINYNKYGQYCHFYDLKLQCYQLNTTCTHDGGSSSISQCQKQCKSKNNSTYWNPITMSCQNCTNNNCTCSSKQIYNPYYNKCMIDCNKIQYAISTTQYSYNTKCACQLPYTWFIEYNMCRVNCTNVLYHDSNTNQGTIEPDRCHCIHNFKFMKKLGAYDQPGICQLICNNGKFGQIKDGKPYCQCQDGQKWDPNTYSCIGTGQRKLGKGMPGWGIALLVIGLLLLLAGIGFLIWRKLKSRKTMKNQTNINKQPTQSSRRTRHHNNQNNQELGTNQNLQQPQKMCQVCQKSETQINCQGPCGHYYHYSCIQQQIDKGQVLCPKCFQVFHNGMSDLKFVEYKEQIHSIADSG